jgi:hypothetical protein
MKPLSDLVNLNEPAWPSVQAWISQSARSCEVLPSPENERREALFNSQVTTRSPMGAIIFESAGILIDGGWLRVLGAGGHSRFNRSLPSWNKGRSKGFLFVADDAVGGFFAINGGYLGNDTGKVYYLAPDTLGWMPLRMSYSEFFVWALGPKLDQFYATLRWDSWRDEAKSLSGDRVISFYPFLWAKGPSLGERPRSPVPISEFFASTYGTTPKAPQAH